MIKIVGTTSILERHRATCHCGAVELELSLPDGIVDPRRCDCSMCRRKVRLQRRMSRGRQPVRPGTRADQRRRESPGRQARAAMKRGDQGDFSGSGRQVRAA
jgi:hypothetical protein